MPTAFPGALDAFSNPTADTARNAVGFEHHAQHANANDAIEALEAKVGITGSAVTTSHTYKITALESSVAALSSTVSGLVTGVSAVAGLTGAITGSALKSALSLNSVENTALSTWAGSTAITTLGTIATGTWSGTTIGISKGGTGQTTANAALNALLPDQSSANGKVLQSNGTDASWQTASGGVALGDTPTWTGEHTFSKNSAASTPTVNLTGTWFTGGSATTTKPHLLIEPSGTTSTAWSTSGTGLGLNAASGFAGNLLDLQVNGVSKLRVDQLGHIYTSAINTDQASGKAHFGYLASGAGFYGTAIGYNASCAGYDGVAIGSSASASAHMTVAIGGGVNFGSAAQASAQGAIAIGADTRASHLAIVLGPGGRSTAANQLVVVATDVYMPAVTAATPSAITFNASGGSGNNIAGANLIFAGGKGTGTGAGGSILFQTAPAGSSGSSLNGLVTRLTIDSTGGLTLGTGASIIVPHTGTAFKASFAGQVMRIDGIAAGGIDFLNFASFNFANLLIMNNRACWTLITPLTEAGYYPLAITPTWNNGSAILEALAVDVTNTASAAGSKLLDLKVGGTSKFKVTKDGAVTFVGGIHTSLTANTDGATITFDCAVSNKHTVTLGGNRTLALTGDTVGETFTIWLKQDGTGSRTVTWWSGISWPGGSPPTLTTTADKTDVFTFTKMGSGAYNGFIVGQNI